MGTFKSIGHFFSALTENCEKPLCNKIIPAVGWTTFAATTGFATGAIISAPLGLGLLPVYAGYVIGGICGAFKAAKVLTRQRHMIPETENTITTPASSAVKKALKTTTYIAGGTGLGFAFGLTSLILWDPSVNFVSHFCMPVGFAAGALKGLFETAHRPVTAPKFPRNQQKPNK